MFELRRRVLNMDMTKYSCCQGYFNCCCLKAGEMGEQSCPECCLCCEVVFCPSCAVSATRMYVMDAKGLQSDPCDRRLIRCNNCLQLLACVCDILAIFCAQFRELAQLIRCVADITYCTIQACFQAQVDLEIRDGSMAGAAPNKQMMMDGQTVVSTTVVQGQVAPGQPVYVQQTGQPMGQQPMYAQPAQPMYAQQPMQGQPVYGQPAYGQPVYVQQQPGQQYMQ